MIAEGHSEDNCVCSHIQAIAEAIAVGVAETYDRERCAEVMDHIAGSIDLHTIGLDETHGESPENTAAFDLLSEFIEALDRAAGVRFNGWGDPEYSN